MKLLKALLPTLLVGILVISGCSHGTSPLNPTPMDTVASISTEGDNSHSLLGLYTLVCNPIDNSIDIITLRESDFHLNALKFLEPPANYLLKIVPPVKIVGNKCDVNLSITHPFLAAVLYTGFDVCGIIFTHGSKTGFHSTDIIMAGQGDARLLNADGYTRWWNPAEFPHGNTMFTYFDGLLGAPASSANYNCTLNGYKYFADGLKSTDPLSLLDPAKRGMFGAGQTIIRHYTIDMGGGLVFNYAIDACWRKPVGNPPYTAPDSFPKGANRIEAYNISVAEIYNNLFYLDSSTSGGGNLKLQVNVWDHFKGNLNQIYGESLDGLPYVGMVAPISGNDVYSTYELDFNGGNLTHGGTGEILIEVRSEAVGYPPALPDKPLCAYFTHTFNIASQPPANSDGWARTWGGGSADRGVGVAADSQGDSYSTGYFSGTTDFDPGDGQYELMSNGGYDIYLSKFNPTGDFQWARTWGATSNEQSYSVDADSMDNVYVSGFFRQTTDFNPGTGVEQRTPVGGDDAFLSKFDADGNFIWVLTWGDEGTLFVDDYAYFVHVDDSDNIYVGGYFDSDMDLDPGPGVDMHVGNGGSDVFLCKLDTAGNFIWGRTWGGPEGDRLYAIAVDSYGDVYTTGSFGGSVDFDPGVGTDMHASNGSTDVFLSKLTTNGDFQAALTWGGNGPDKSAGVSVGPAGDVYVAGNYWNTIDFDPGAGIDLHSSNGEEDIFITKFYPSLAYAWTLTWGGSHEDDTHGMSIRGGNVFATGYFGYSMDIDPTAGVDMRTSNGYEDIFLIKLDAYAHYIWARTWGGAEREFSGGLDADNLGNLFLTGGFDSDEIDFDPGPSEDNHPDHGFGDVYLIKILPDGYW